MTILAVLLTVASLAAVAAVAHKALLSAAAAFVDYATTPWGAARAGARTAVKAGRAARRAQHARPARDRPVRGGAARPWAEARTGRAAAVLDDGAHVAGRAGGRWSGAALTSVGTGVRAFPGGYREGRDHIRARRARRAQPPAVPAVTDDPAQPAPTRPASAQPAQPAQPVAADPSPAQADSLGGARKGCPRPNCPGEMAPTGPTQQGDLAVTSIRCTVCGLQDVREAPHETPAGAPPAANPEGDTVDFRGVALGEIPDHSTLIGKLKDLFGLASGDRDGMARELARVRAQLADLTLAVRAISGLPDRLGPHIGGPSRAAAEDTSAAASKVASRAAGLLDDLGQLDRDMSALADTIATAEKTAVDAVG